MPGDGWIAYGKYFKQRILCALKLQKLLNNSIRDGARTNTKKPSNCGSAKKLSRPKKLKIDEPRIAEYSTIYSALSEPLRLRIISILSVQPLCVCVIKEIIRIPDSKLSYHLSILKNAGLVNSRRDGNWIMYNLTEIGNRHARLINSKNGKDHV
jgi:DNA-binding transcriptional ArsR family regulator